MAKIYTQMTVQELKAEQKILEERYNAFKAKNLKLDMSRGKPGKDQLDLSDAMNDVKDYISDGFDVRNYGLMDGIKRKKKGLAIKEYCAHHPNTLIIYHNGTARILKDELEAAYM